MNIAQITDTHIQRRESSDPRGVARAENLRRCIAHINARGSAVDAVVHTGDITDDGSAEATLHARDLLRDLVAPVYIIAGNRDDRHAVRSTFADHGYLPSESWHLSYVIEAGPVRVVALDSVEAGSPGGHVCAERLSWLDSVLARRADQPTVLFLHHPPFLVADHPRAFREQANADALAAVVAPHRQVVSVICGHIHRPGQVPWGGTVGRSTACVAGDLRKGPALRGQDGAEVDGAPVYALHAVGAGGRIETTLQVVPDQG